MATKRKQMAVVQDPEAPVPAEVLAQSVVEVSASAKRLLASGLTPEALALLVNHNIPSDMRPGVTVVRRVLEAAARLDDFVVKK